MNAPSTQTQPFRPAPRVASIGLSEILTITARAGALKRAGRPMIVLGAVTCACAASASGRPTPASAGVRIHGP